ncbi:MAG: hypothetical protein AAF297_08510 [Planctomycetota bacterium]
MNEQEPQNANPTKGSPRAFLTLFAAALLLALGGVAIASAVIDPFRVYRLGLRDDLNPHKLDVGRVMKAQMIRSNNAATVVLGSSRVNRGINPEDPAWRQTPVVNASVGGARIDELAHAIRLAASEPETERIVVFVDFYMTTQPTEGLHDYKQSLLNPELTLPARHATALVSRRAIDASLKVLENRDNGLQHNSWPFNGYRSMGAPKGARDHRKLFDDMARDSLRMMWMYGNYTWYDGTIARLAEALERAERPGLNITLAVMPVHAEHLAIIDAARLWPDFERFKCELTRVGAERAIEVWDFAVLHEVTTEPIPPRGSRKPMTYWWESSHSTETTGALVINRLNPTPNANAASPTPTESNNPLGVRITPANIDNHLGTQRAAYDAWAENNPGDLANIERILSQIPPRLRPPKRRDG